MIRTKQKQNILKQQLFLTQSRSSAFWCSSLIGITEQRLRLLSTKTFTHFYRTCLHLIQLCLNRTRCQRLVMRDGWCVRKYFSLAVSRVSNTNSRQDFSLEDIVPRWACLTLTERNSEGVQVAGLQQLLLRDETKFCFYLWSRF